MYVCMYVCMHVLVYAQFVNAQVHTHAHELMSDFRLHTSQKIVTTSHGENKKTPSMARPKT